MHQQPPEKTGIGSKIKRVLQGRFGRTIMFSLIGLTIVSWIVALSILAMFDLSIGQRMAVVTVPAVVTEATMWVSAAVLGVSLYQKIKDKFRRKG